jgi:Spy/CpxP family protein refolding chaperone
MSQKTKLFIAIIMFIAAGSYGWMKVRSVTPGAVANNGITDEFSGGEDREQRMQQMAKAANITPEQQQKLEEVREKHGDDWRQGREEMQKILSPEQRDKIRENFQQQRVLRDAKTQKMMSDAEYKRYQEKRAERFGGRGGRRGGGDRGGSRNARPSGGATSQSNSASNERAA